MRLNNDTYTYICDSGCNMSWIDHILCSRSVDSLIVNMRVLQDFVSSDHKPLSVSLTSLSCKYLFDPATCNDAADTLASPDNVTNYSYCWDVVNGDSLQMYSSLIDECLGDINIANELLSCCDSKCNNNGHLASMKQYSNAIQSRIQQTMNLVIPANARNHVSDYIIPGWNDIVQDKHEAAREAC